MSQTAQNCHCLYVVTWRIVCRSAELLQANQELRPITAADFDDARQHVTPSTNPDSMVTSELKQWNATYGESGNKGYRQHLSYFI